MLAYISHEISWTLDQDGAVLCGLIERCLLKAAFWFVDALQRCPDDVIDTHGRARPQHHTTLEQLYNNISVLDLEIKRAGRQPEWLLGSVIACQMHRKERRDKSLMKRKTLLQ